MTSNSAPASSCERTIFRSFIFKSALAVLLLGGLTVVGYKALDLVQPSERDAFASIVGAAATIFAGWLAWQSVSLQFQREQLARSERASAARLDVALSIAQAAHAASALINLIDQEIELTNDPHGRSLRVKQGAQRLFDVLDREALLIFIGDLSADHRANLLMFVQSIRVSVVFARLTDKETNLTRADLRAIRDPLAKLHLYLYVLDQDLRKSFIRDANLSGEETSLGHQVT